MKRDNIASQATARANGMRLVEAFTDAEGEESVTYRITRQEWLQNS